MKRIIKTIIAFVIILSVILPLMSCGKYTSSYRAMGLIKNQTSHSLTVSFSSLEGQLVFKIKRTDKGREGDIKYYAAIEGGELSLHYDIYGTKDALAHISGGETVNSRGGYVESGRNVYIIIEAKNAKNGKVQVELNPQSWYVEIN